MSNISLSGAFFLCSLLLPCLACQSCKALDEEAGWSRYAHNPVIRPGRKDGGTFYDYYNLNDACVLKEGAVFKIWYSTSGATAMSQVNHCSISYAESQDGIHWTKYPDNPVLDIDPASWDTYAVETVSVIIDPDDGPDRRYKLWYAGRTSDQPGNPAYDIGFAASSDGIHWTKSGAPVLRRGERSDWDNSFIEGPSVIKQGGLFYLWYAGMDAIADGQPTDGKVNIGLATSPDGIVWTKHPSNPVLRTGAPGSWDSRTVQDPSVVFYGGSFHMWYGGKDGKYPHYGQQIGYAESDDGVVWRKSAANPSFKRGEPGAWDSVTASFGAVLIDEDKVKLWYTGMNKDSGWGAEDFYEIGYAEKRLPVGGIHE